MFFDLICLLLNTQGVQKWTEVDIDKNEHKYKYKGKYKYKYLLNAGMASDAKGKRGSAANLFSLEIQILKEYNFQQNVILQKFIII